MNILLLDANGRTGREVLKRALEAGDAVTALVRDKATLADIRDERLGVGGGDVCDPEVVASVLLGQDVVISALGPRSISRSACRIYSDAAVAIVEAMERSEVRRLLVTSTALLFPPRRLLDRVLRLVARNNCREAARMEERIRASGLDWTIARVGFLTSGPSTEFRHAVDAFPEKGGAVSRAALARFLHGEAADGERRRRVVGLSA